MIDEYLAKGKDEIEIVKHTHTYITLLIYYTHTNPYL